MRLPFREFWQLRGIERRLRRSEPHMAAMLAIFTRLNAGEAIMSRDQRRWRGDRARDVLSWLANAMAVLAACTAAVARWAFRQAAGVRAALGELFSRTAGAPLSPSSAARDRRDHGRSPGP